MTIVFGDKYERFGMLRPSFRLSNTRAQPLLEAGVQWTLDAVTRMIWLDGVYDESLHDDQQDWISGLHNTVIIDFPRNFLSVKHIAPNLVESIL